MPAADPITALLDGTYVDPESGEALRAESRAIVIEDSLDGAEASLCEGLDLGHRLAVISDADTHEALGARVERALGGRFSVQSVILPPRPRCDTQTVDRALAAVDYHTDAIVAVGSGTINDLSKLVAHARDVPQVVFGTAPSMNGYTSVSASIIDRGMKRSVRAATPVGAFFDLDVIAHAPARMIRAGLGDSLCRSTAQIDWLMAHLVLGREYREVPFTLLADDEAALFAEPAALLGGDLGAMRHLVRTLVLSGLGMTICGGSYPASQGEHLMAHYVAMVADHGDALHGEEVGVCTLAMARLQDAMLAGGAPRLYASTITREEVLARFGALAGDACWSELAPKLCDAHRAEELSAHLAATWDATRARLSRIALGERRLRAVLEAAGAPTEPAAIGWSQGLWDDARHHAREIRNRYTFLDLAADARVSY